MDAVTAATPGRWVWRGSASRFACPGFADPEKLALVSKYGRTVPKVLPRLVTHFVSEVAWEQGLEQPRLRADQQ